MPKFKIVLGAYRYEENTMEVEADTLEEAIATAYRDDDCEYEAWDLGESFVSDVLDETGAVLDFPDEHRDPNMDPVQLRRAAPDLLARLKEMVRLFAPLHTSDQTATGPLDQTFGGMAISSARDAIAMAEGRTNG